MLGKAHAKKFPRRLSQISTLFTSFTPTSNPRFPPCVFSMSIYIGPFGIDIAPFHLRKAWPDSKAGAKQMIEGDPYLGPSSYFPNKTLWTDPGKAGKHRHCVCLLMCKTAHSNPAVKSLLRHRVEFHILSHTFSLFLPLFWLENVVRSEGCNIQMLQTMLDWLKEKCGSQMYKGELIPIYE